MQYCHDGSVTAHTTLNATPTQLVFGCNVFLPVTFQADWAFIANRKQRLIVQNNKQENAKRHSVNDSVMILHDPNQKHGDDTYKGPFVFTKVNDNVTLQLRIITPYGCAKCKICETYGLSKPDPL